MNFRCPFVSRARFEDREREILELKRNLADLEFKHARVLDEINFRNTGFHVDPRFVVKVEPGAPMAAPEPAEELTGVAKAINEVGHRPSAIRGYMERTQMSELEKAEALARKGREQQLKAQAADRMEEILKAGKTPATA